MTTRQTATSLFDAGITETIIGCAIRVQNTLGVGFLEKVYENALAHELRKHGLFAEQQKPIRVHYDGVMVGEYYADLLVEGRAVVEIKSTRAVEPVHQAQLLNYLKATGVRVGLLLNFGTPHLGIKRLVF